MNTPDSQAQPEALRNRFLTFMLEKETYGIEINFVTEIIGVQNITVLHNMAEFIKGVIKLRDSVIPVIDIRRHFKRESKDYDERTCIIVVEIGDISVGLIVDSVSEILTIDAENLLELPKVSSSASYSYIKSIGEYEALIIMILDIENLFTGDELHEIGTLK